VSKDAAILDVGGGASRLVDGLVEEGYSARTVLDLSEGAFALVEPRPNEYATPMGRVQRFQSAGFGGPVR
jgi:hypothetical protein